MNNDATLLELLSSYERTLVTLERSVTVVRVLVDAIEAGEHPSSQSLLDYRRQCRASIAKWRICAQCSQVLRRRFQCCIEMPDPSCTRCVDGWVCKRHPDQPWPHLTLHEPDGQCAGPGMLCDCPAGVALARTLDAKYRGRSRARQED